MALPAGVKKHRLRFRHYLYIALAVVIASVVWVSYLGSEADSQFAAFAVACDGAPVELARTASSSRRGVAFERDAERKWRVRLFGIPDDWTADKADGVGFVACLEPERRVPIGRCGFREGIGVRVLGISVAGVSTGGVTVYERVQHELPIRVVAPHTGKSIADGVIRGGSPVMCDRYVGKPGESTFEGSSVDATAIGAWLSENLPRE